MLKDKEGLQRQLRNSYTSFQASDPCTKSVEGNWTEFRTIILIPLRNIFLKRPSTRKRLLHGLIHALNVLFTKSSDCRKFKNLRNMVHNTMRRAHENYINKLHGEQFHKTWPLHMRIVPPFGLRFTNAVKNFTKSSMEISLTVSKNVPLPLKHQYIRMSPNPVLKKDV